GRFRAAARWRPHAAGGVAALLRWSSRNGRVRRWRMHLSDGAQFDAPRRRLMSEIEVLRRRFTRLTMALLEMSSVAVAAHDFVDPPGFGGGPDGGRTF